jgi:hypothetical protein
MFESAFDLSRFKDVKGNTPKDRAEDVGQLSPTGQLLLSVATMIEYPNTLRAGACFRKISRVTHHTLYLVLDPDMYDRGQKTSKLVFLAEYV